LDCGPHTYVEDIYYRSSWNTRAVTFNYWFWFFWNVWNGSRRKKSSFLSPVEHFSARFDELANLNGLA